MPICLPHRILTSLVHTGSVEPVGGASAAIPQQCDARVRERERLIDEQLAQSFPASDPPGWVQGTAQPPR